MDKEKKRSLTRRGFLKSTAAVAAGISVASVAGGTLALAEGNADGQSEAGGEQIFRGVCRPNCFGFCHLNVHVRDGNIVKTSRAPYDNPAYSRICQRGLSHVQRIYNDQRVKYPMRRVEGTARGEGQWERISWDEAIGEIVSKMQEYMGQYGSTAVAIEQGSTQGCASPMIYTRLTQALNLSFVVPSYDAASAYAMSRTTGTVQGWYANERTDLVNSKTIVAWGANVTDAQVQQWHFIKEAMANGVKLVVVDPTFTQLASKADKWISTRPGTDPAVYLGVMNQIFERDAVDVEFVGQHTVGPFLVREDTGKFLRWSEVNEEAAAAKAAQEAAAQQAALQAMQAAAGQGEIIAGMAYQSTLEAMAYDDQPVVMEKGALMPANQSSAPDLYGATQAAGTKCTSALTLLRDSVAGMTPEKVAEIADIPVETFLELTDICLDGPVTHYVGYGAQAFVNGVQSTHAGITMSALTGNLGKPGASFGAFWTLANVADMAFAVGAGIGTAPMIVDVYLPEVVASGKYLGEDRPIKMLFIATGNPLNCSTDTNLLKKTFDAIDYIVVADPMMTDTTNYADLVLPVCQWFETEEITQIGENVTISFNEKAIDPLYESKSDVEIVKLIADRFGLGDYFPADASEALKMQFGENNEKAKALGATYDELKEKKEVRWEPDDVYIAFKDGQFLTPHGRLEFYVEDPQVRFPTQLTPTEEDIALEHLPHWFPPLHAWHENEEHAKYPLVCMSERARFRVHSQWHSVPALNELDPEPIVRINPADAQERGIEDRTYVECYNDLGHVVARAHYSDAIRPGTLVYPKGWHASQFKAGNWSEIIPNDFDVFGAATSFMDTVCEIRPWDEGSEK
ncbi:MULTISPECIES: molybdopterin-dependent oxidoreductase [unclassified Adlercreutzia]|uniref:molybdopterin-dependent oxidoreductase n=1 Tax=unclassified Adlercreutzia TaxID=2636013 RepID=UPI0013EA5AF5|nr:MULTISPECIES: molybdopterin-dependent oxidoreductase [unclassified Adlercreutzia]